MLRTFSKYQLVGVMVARKTFYSSFNIIRETRWFSPEFFVIASNKKPVIMSYILNQFNSYIEIRAIYLQFHSGSPTFQKGIFFLVYKKNNSIKSTRSLNIYLLPFDLIYWLKFVNIRNINGCNEWTIWQPIRGIFSITIRKMIKQFLITKGNFCGGFDTAKSSSSLTVEFEEIIRTTYSAHPSCSSTFLCWISDFAIFLYLPFLGWIYKH